MRALTEPFEEQAEYQGLKERLQNQPGVVELTGCIDSQKLHMVHYLSDGGFGRLIITFSEQQARQICEEYRFFDRDVIYYPAKDILFYQSDLRGNELLRERVRVLKVLSENKEFTVVTTFDAIMSRIVGPESFLPQVRRLEPGNVLDLSRLQKELAKMGYERCYQAEAPGQFAVRGGIIDIFGLAEENPYRIEMWGDEIDSIRSYDASSQRSIENLERISVYPANEDTFKEDDGEEGHATSSLLDYLDKERVLIALDEPMRLFEQGTAVEREYTESMRQRLEKGYVQAGQGEELFRTEEVFARLNRMHTVALTTFERNLSPLEIKDSLTLETRSVNPYNNSFELLVKDLYEYKKKNYKVILLSASITRARRLAEDITNEGLNAFFTQDYDQPVKPGEIMLLYGKVRKGYEYPSLGFVVISESDIFGAEKKKKRRRKKYEGEKIADFSDLHIGDYVVHENHGLGIYRGIEKIEVEKTTKDYIKIEYAKGSSLYILATQLDMIQKYAGADAGPHKLNNLGGQDWRKTKARVRKAVQEIAGELVELYAVRENKRGYVYGPDTVWQREFEELFPFEETEDQELAIEATKKDMESPKIMDRLICGDVGYGKTEIAIRAAFKAVQESKQVVYLAPTTILAQQVYNNFSNRMKDYPIELGLLCRFRTPSQQKKTIEDLKKGMVDIVVGTHRVLSKDVQYKDLGLLIIDEEQRFGVKHKEKIKQLKNDVDVLTLTATPIPRTLHMSLIGIRDMSVLEEPPVDRVPIQTYVMEYNEELVREAIHRELARGGQVYYVFNRVNQIEDVTLKIKSLVPDAEIAFAHGQMPERALEDIMFQFIKGEIDVLVSTTIIETGLDIPNVNTMIIHDADNMGLSQLYQLRGRVGRSNRTAYAFLMYRRDKMLKEVAEKRLAAIREYTDLGSGFKIAMRDLEIRGAGNLLGAQQSGHMEAVGYDLYCKMLNEAVKKAKGLDVGEDFETTIDVEVDAFIPAAYIQNEVQKLDIYKRIAVVENEEDKEAMLEELLDRFGEPTKSVLNLLEVSLLRTKAHALFIREIKQQDTFLRLTMYGEAKLDVAKIPDLVKEMDGRLTFSPMGKEPVFRYNMVQNSRDTKNQKLDILVQVRKVLVKFRLLYHE